ncbi:MAG: hypothetical protein OXE79_06370 [Acidimicrobiaceae bacterium]|nr:hypothetical protein [Acidimicrobiaceae bacterium]MCY4174840.1 hypothetical protein [Acidimicrobiaceae bacterium]MCY4281029.1 hypothetical protein [Acidimicrobiaceae bacterium]MCY4294879.1 hypothetical protein [Acidimicrobiaceae bacterium]
MAQRRKLIFFTTADPRSDCGALFRAYHFAAAAAGAGLEAEVRLAGEAVAVADLETIPDTDMGRDVRQKVAAGREAAFAVSF